MRVQANSFRLPALKLQPKESQPQFSLSYGDQNQSSSSMIKYQSNPQRFYDPSPVKKRYRGMSIAVYNSQEKLKTAEFKYIGDFVTQPPNHSSSAVNTVRQYRSKLKQLMSQPQKEEGGLSRDPRIYSFKEPAATIRLDKLNKNNEAQFSDKVRELMGRVKLLMSSQQFYHEPEKQDNYKVTLVKLKDEYECLYQDFNDYYIQNKKIDKVVLQLLNHMEIIKQLLIPKKPIQNHTLSQVILQVKEPLQEIIEPTPDPPQELIIPEIPQPVQLPSPQSSYAPREESVFTPLTSLQLNEEEIQSQNDNSFSNEDSNESPITQGKSPKKKRNNKQKKSPRKSQKSLAPSDKDLSCIETLPLMSSQKLISNQPSSRSRRAEQTQRTLSKQFSGEQISVHDSEQQLEDQSPEKSPLKRTVSNMGSLNKRRTTILEGQNGERRRKKGATTISELEDSQSDQQENQGISEGEEKNESEKLIDEIKAQQFEDPLLDKLIQADNIYLFPYFQTWEYHNDKIIDGYIFGEYDL